MPASLLKVLWFSRTYWALAIVQAATAAASVPPRTPRRARIRYTATIDENDSNNDSTRADKKLGPPNIAHTA